MGKKEKEAIVNGFRITYKEKDAKALYELFGKNIEEEARKMLKEKKAKKKNVDKQ